MLIGHVDDEDDAYDMTSKIAKRKIVQRKDESVQQYFGTFENARLISGMPEAVSVAFFIAALRSPLDITCSKDYMGRTFVTLRDALQYAQHEESKLSRSAQGAVNAMRSHGRGRGRGRGRTSHDNGNNDRNVDNRGVKRSHSQGDNGGRGGGRGGRGGGRFGPNYKGCFTCGSMFHTASWHTRGKRARVNAAQGNDNADA